ncbi:ATP-dependent DNA helicase [Rhodospirillaceae bacterium SYSU D60014]|uniref:ATP-dependent DNA helicase n=1 Tax=Virgifigura deserti TaxID=2268457 RepID=UPI000E66AB17
MTRPHPQPAALKLPDAPVLVTGLTQTAWLDPTGEIETLALDAAAARVKGRPPILCHAPATARRLGLEGLAGFDLLELFAFVHPARFCLPTPRGLALALGLPAPIGIEDEAATLHAAMRALLTTLADPAAGRPRRDRRLQAIGAAMARGGWAWGPAVLAALGHQSDGKVERSNGFAVWDDLEEWSEHAPEPPPGNVPVEPTEARRRLAALLGAGAETRPQQADYASAVSAAFTPRAEIGAPRLVLAEAGTGVGKTLGYLAPASLWAEKNGGAVWISTYTRNLQHQIDGELDRLYPDRTVKALKAVVRKGRENYLCLLNLEEAVRALPTRPQDAVALGLMARWAEATRDGDLTGGDFPGWLADLIGRGRSLGLADRRGECIHSACPHYHKCYIERSVRRARRAEIVVANHALVMIQAALADTDETDEGRLPSRYVFDEGHHVFDAADGAFSGHLSGQETAELRRWLLGAEGGRQGRLFASRARGLKRRIEDLVTGETGGGSTAEADLAEALRAARALPGEAWHQRLADGAPDGPAERFLAAVRQQVYARAQGATSPYSLETETTAPLPELTEAATALDEALARLQRPIARLIRRLAARLEDEAETLDTTTRLRIEAVVRGLRRRGEVEIGGWRAMLQALATETPPAFVDWFSVDRLDGRDIDVGMHRHWIDPTVPFAAAVAAPAQGLLITSATLTDGGGEDPSETEAFWTTAEARTGAVHLPAPAIRARVPSPFDYSAQTRVFVVTDVRKDDLDQVAAAYRALFLASGGGALGLFTAIARLRGVHRRIAPALDAAGLPLLAQHVDGLDTSTLVDIFRAEEDACLLGTDAVRDGVDVPGRSLRLIVFDRVPWPRPDILHRARKAAFGGRAYDDRLTRLKLRQAFGRLVRRADDRGAFVLLDPMMPSRLADAFPGGVAVSRVGLAEAAAAVREFLRAKPHPGS